MANGIVAPGSTIQGQAVAPRTVEDFVNIPIAGILVQQCRQPSGVPWKLSQCKDDPVRDSSVKLTQLYPFFPRRGSAFSMFALPAWNMPIPFQPRRDPETALGYVLCRRVIMQIQTQTMRQMFPGCCRFTTAVGIPVGWKP
jgi:hypothetical protein